MKSKKNKNFLIKTWDWLFENIVFLNPNLWPWRETFARTLGLSLTLSFFFIKGTFLLERIVWMQESGVKSFFLSGNTSLFSFADIDLIVWAIEMIIVLSYSFIYLIRQSAKNIAYGFKEVVYPILIATLPFFILFSPENLATNNPQHYVWYVAIAFSFMLVGAIINLIGLLQLRRAFSVMAEARTLVKTGLYKYIRHPIYTGHFLLFFGSLCFHFYWQTALCYMVFIIGQTYRARIEESKLEKTFPKYKSYRTKTGMFFPKL